MITVADIQIKNPVFLAPMSGVSDLPFRRLAFRFGAGLVVSEMVASDQLIAGEEEAALKTAGAGIFPHIIQLAGRQAEAMENAAKKARDCGADMIDINMGCPAKKVTGGYSGSALMKDLDHALTLIEACVNAVDCPVTLKMRLGWDRANMNAADLAKRAENAGVQMITVHGRTRDQFYKGKADWSEIASVKSNVSIPVIANGDITSIESAFRALELSQCDGLMVGRGCYGRPWLPGQIADFLAGKEPKPSPSGDALSALVLDHYEALLEHYGVHVGVRAARKHLDWYLCAQPGLFADVTRAERGELLTSTDPCAVRALVRELFTRHAGETIKDLETAA